MCSYAGRHVLSSISTIVDVGDPISAGQESTGNIDLAGGRTGLAEANWCYPPRLGGDMLFEISTVTYPTLGGVSLSLLLFV